MLYCIARDMPGGQIYEATTDETEARKAASEGARVECRLDWVTHSQAEKWATLLNARAGKTLYISTVEGPGDRKSVV